MVGVAAFSSPYMVLGSSFLCQVLIVTQVNLNWWFGWVVWWLRGGVPFAKQKPGVHAPNQSKPPPIHRKLNKGAGCFVERIGRGR